MKTIKTIKSDLASCPSEAERPIMSAIMLFAWLILAMGIVSIVERL